MTLPRICCIRFLDDCLLGWSHGRDQFDEFVDYLNSVHKSVIFMAEFSECRVPFLNLNTNLDNGRILTDLYCKPTNSHNYLHFNSAHPQHDKTRFPYSQYLRLKFVCSREEDFINHSQMITFHFLRWRYPKELLAKAFDNGKGQKQEYILKWAISQKR